MAMAMEMLMAMRGSSVELRHGHRISSIKGRRGRRKENRSHSLVAQALAVLQALIQVQLQLQLQAKVQAKVLVMGTDPLRRRLKRP
jgi:hypothetical protein